MCSLGSTAQEMFDALSAGRNGLAPIRGFTTDWYTSDSLFEIDDRDESGDRPGRATGFLLQVIAEALADAGLSDDLGDIRCWSAPACGTALGRTVAGDRRLGASPNCTSAPPYGAGSAPGTRTRSPTPVRRPSTHSRWQPTCSRPARPTPSWWRARTRSPRACSAWPTGSSRSRRMRCGPSTGAPGHHPR
ncbi:hypothetical protein NKG94_03220 [Micromonospora sp. M12]